MSAALKLPSIKDQTAFNLERWEALAHDEQVRGGALAGEGGERGQGDKGRQSGP